MKKPSCKSVASELVSRAVKINTCLETDTGGLEQTTERMTDV